MTIGVGACFSDSLEFGGQWWSHEENQMLLEMTRCIRNFCLWPESVENLLTLLTQFFKGLDQFSAENDAVIKYSCLISQESLCGKFMRKSLTALGGQRHHSLSWRVVLLARDDKWNKKLHFPLQTASYSLEPTTKGDRFAKKIICGPLINPGRRCFRVQRPKIPAAGCLSPLFFPRSTPFIQQK